MRVAVVYNQPEPSPPDEHWLHRSAPGRFVPGADFLDASEVGVSEEVGQIGGFLREGGYDTLIFEAQEIPELVRFLREERPDVVFNCCESFRGNAALEMNVAALYELLAIPFTGSPALTLGIALNKALAKALFRAHGVPTAPYVVFSPEARCAFDHDLGFPVIVKPLCEDASIGIDADSVVSSQVDLRRRVQFVWDEFRQPALVEEFVEGRELYVALLATSPEEFAALPVSEILFQDLPQGSPCILTYEAKWMLHSAAYQSTMPNCPADLSAPLLEQVRTVALNAARAIGLRDYGRVDLRLRAGDDAIFVLEANPNPDITHDSGFVRSAKASGRTHADTIVAIVERAIERTACRHGVRPAGAHDTSVA